MLSNSGSILQPDTASLDNVELLLFNLIILIIYICVVYPSGAIVFISYLFNFNTDNSILLVGYTFVSSYNGVAMISFSVNTNLSFGTVNVYS